MILIAEIQRDLLDPRGIEVIVLYIVYYGQARKRWEKKLTSNNTKYF